MDQKKAEAERIIEALGGTVAVADLCGIKPPSVSDWKKNGIPRAWLRFFMSAHPGIFGGAQHNNTDDAQSAALVAENKS